MSRSSMIIEYGKFLVELGEKIPSLVALEADLKESTQSVQFQKKFPERYFDIGIAEQNMVGIAAGLSLAGKLPVVHSFASFISMRACEQVRTSIAYPNLNVKFVATHGGISAGSAGATHHAIEDIAIMRSIPGMVVIAPGDAEEMRQSVAQAFKHKGPVYIRLNAGDSEDTYGKGTKFKLGRGTLLRDGKDITIISTGTMMQDAYKLSELLNRKNISVRVLQFATIKPIDKDLIYDSLVKTNIIFTLEEHNLLGGLGSAVAEIVSELGLGKLFRFGINDQFCNVGSYDCLKEEALLGTNNILKKIIRIFNDTKKNKR